ncbi:MAG: 50S ribosomal protein L18 [Desulfobacterales bacterium]|jgi:large subunit ribosomal protein L18|nr:50S ribosomal protein L18 [Desulfobacter sp.]MDP6394293.1 50S ribosomal protein L18 [Desulfobacterales bacterium]MDP6682320.1 50S ribosomal protein L18 [Desulfobacterales bacterium]MDP6807632.1 50S ribosomal protein L18 [Desulfobacterales bacterium]MDP7353482.1 50S ribosomal protein L18 [Desulfobacterales bacterium]|tara:strand:- start:804 stop:1172 length:369 start_codon:yes stop_codon:yes gene_type:complete
MDSLNFRKRARLKRKKRIRKNIFGTTERPRLTVFRTTKHIYAQIIDDTAGHTLASASTMQKAINKHLGKGKRIAVANLVGKSIAERAIKKGIQKVIFDRNGFLYHGRVKAVSDGARKAGLDF